MNRIVILTEHYFEYRTGGAEYQLYLLIRELLRAGYDVHYIFIGDETGREPSMDIKLHPVKEKILSRKFGANIFLYKSDIYNVLEKIKPDLIYQRSAPALCGIAAIYSRKKGCRLVWHIAHKNNVEHFHVNSLKTLVFDYLNKKCAEYGLKKADTIIGQAKYQEVLLYKNYKKKCDLIVGNWHPFPEEMNDKSLPVKVVWIANFKPHKQPDIFIRLAEKLGYIDGVEFKMVGRPASGKFQEELEFKISKIDNLHYLGELPNPDVNELLSKSHILVSTSRSEGFSNTFIQAWMHEVPVVSLFVDPDDVLKNEKIGFHSGNFENLVRDTKVFIENGILLSQMGKRAAGYAKKNHSLDRIKEVISLFESDG